MLARLNFVGVVLSLLVAASCVQGAVLLKAGPDVQVQPTGTNTSTFTYFGIPHYTADDGVFTQDKSGGFTVRSVPFNKTLGQVPNVGFIDHVKWLAYTAKPFEIGPNQTIVFRTKVAAQVSLPDKLPSGFNSAIKDASDDMRLATAAITVLDLSTGMQFDFVITNKGVWPAYERLPLARSPTNAYRAFTSTFKGANRTSPAESSDLEIMYNRGAGTVTWSIDGKAVQTIKNIGAFPSGKSTAFNPIVDLGGVDPIKPVDITSLSLGFGTFNLLDETDPNDKASTTGLVQLTAPDSNGTSAYVKPAAFVDAKSEESSRLFGAGATLKVYDFSVELL